MPPVCIQVNPLWFRHNLLISRNSELRVTNLALVPTLAREEERPWSARWPSRELGDLQDLGLLMAANKVDSSLTANLGGGVGRAIVD